MASADDELVPGCRWRDLPVLCDNLRGIGPTGEVAAAVIVALAALRAAPTPEGETLLRETAGALWDLQSAPDCWCDTGEGNPHTEACMEATRVSRRLVAAKIHLSPASPAPTPATPKHGRSVPEGLCTACGTEPCAEHELPEPTPDGRESVSALFALSVARDYAHEQHQRAEAAEARADSMERAIHKVLDADVMTDLLHGTGFAEILQASLTDPTPTEGQ